MPKPENNEATENNEVTETSDGHKICQTFKDHPSQVDIDNPKLVTCPNCETDVIPEIEQKWDHPYHAEKSCFECLFPCCAGNHEDEQLGEDEIIRLRDKTSNRVYIHVCPQCGNRIFYGTSDEVEQVYD